MFRSSNWQIRSIEPDILEEEKYHKTQDDVLGFLV